MRRAKRTRRIRALRSRILSRLHLSETAPFDDEYRDTVYAAWLDDLLDELVREKAVNLRRVKT